MAGASSERIICPPATSALRSDAAEAAPSLDLGSLFNTEEDLIRRVASFCDLRSLSNLSKTCRRCRHNCEPLLRAAKQKHIQQQQERLLPRKEGTCKVHQLFDPNRYLFTGEKADVDLLWHEVGRWTEVSSAERVLSRKARDLRACDIVLIDDAYDGAGACFVAVREGRLVLIQVGGELRCTTLPPDAYVAGKRYGYNTYYWSCPFLKYAELPEDSEEFLKYEQHRPSEGHSLYFWFDNDRAHSLEHFDGIPSEEPLGDIFFWSKSTDPLVEATW